MRKWSRRNQWKRKSWLAEESVSAVESSGSDRVSSGDSAEPVAETENAIINLNVEPNTHQTTDKL